MHSFEIIGDKMHRSEIIGTSVNNYRFKNYWLRESIGQMTFDNFDVSNRLTSLFGIVITFEL